MRCCILYSGIMFAIAVSTDANPKKILISSCVCNFCVFVVWHADCTDGSKKGPYVNWWNMHLVDSMHCYCLKVIWGNSGSAFMLSCCLDLSQKCKSKIIFAFALYSIMLCGVMVSELGLVMVRSVATSLSWACIQVHCILTFTLSKALRLQHIQVLSLDDLFVFLWCISE